VPNAPLRPCAEPGCGSLVPKGRCPEHARTKDKARGTAQQRGYDYAWAQYSINWRQQHPMCGERMDGMIYTEHSECARENIVSPAEVVDHIVPMSRGGSKWDPANHQSLCRSCNTAKGDRCDGRRG
jgi:5-methylcytosine-specific restriction enzyme A